MDERLDAPYATQLLIANSRISALESALKQAIETIQKAVNAFPSPSAEAELIELRKVLEGK